MNLSQRSRLSICQFLTLFNVEDLSILLDKYGLSTDELEYHRHRGRQGVTAALKATILPASASQLGDLVQEFARTHGSMRTDVSPRHRFDGRWNDLLLCLKLDGYAREQNEYGIELDRFVPIEPMIEGADSVEDDLTKELRRSGLLETDGIIQVLDGSAGAFRSGDFKGCLNAARVALQTLARAIAKARLPNHPGSFDPEKWGQVIAYLRKSSFITEGQERGLAGVFGFISPGSHVPVGFSKDEFARLGRALAVSICYFLAKRINAPPME